MSGYGYISGIEAGKDFQDRRKIFHPSESH
jgi:hypothetical protein